MNIGFYAIKIIAIVYSSFLYFLGGTLLSVMLDKIVPDTEPNNKSSLKLFIEIAGIISLIAIGYYIIRNMIQYIPFPLDKQYGFTYSLLKEASGGVIISYILFTYQDKLKAMMIELQKRITKQLIIK
jgi:hypothetical protein